MSIPKDPKEATEYTRKTELETLWRIVLIWTFTVIFIWSKISSIFVIAMMIIATIYTMMWLRLSYIGWQLRKIYQREIDKNV